MRSFFAGTLHRLTPDRSPTTGRQSIDEVIAGVWRSCAAGKITWGDASAARR